MRWGFLFFIVISPAWADIDPGNWELSVATEVQGIKEPVSLVQTRCLTAEEAHDPSRLFGSSPAARCQFVNRSDTGSVFTFEIACGAPPQPPISGSGKVRYSSDSLDGELELKAEHFVTRSRISGRRIGGC